jgi:tetratricopeptide (TPR) repeat protein
LQWVVFFVAALLVAGGLRHVPGFGSLFQGIWGFWIAVILVSAAASWLSARWIDRTRLGRRRRELGLVETAHNQGKLGTLLLQHGRPRAAIAVLERAVAGEPDLAEWHYRLGSALRACGEPARAAQELERALALAPAHAWGEVAIELALARRTQGDDPGALQALDAHDREHGESVRSAYLRGAALRRLGRAEEARAAFRAVGLLAHRLPAFSRRGTLRWRVRAALLRQY